jgi:NADP-dependent 3-hydroxy acid dehydrogenase YdfG
LSLLTSTAGLVSSAGLSQYSATKHALKALADILREEVNPHGVRVLSVYLGRTATPMQAGIRQTEGKSYRPDQLIQPDQVAAVVVGALTIGPEAEIMDVRIRPTLKPRP